MRSCKLAHRQKLEFRLQFSIKCWFQGERHSFLLECGSGCKYNPIQEIQTNGQTKRLHTGIYLNFFVLLVKSSPHKQS